MRDVTPIGKAKRTSPIVEKKVERPTNPSKTLNIYQRLDNFTHDFPGVASKRKNKGWDSDYFNITDLWTAIKPYLKKHEMGVLQIPHSVGIGDIIVPVLLTQLYCTGDHCPPDKENPIIASQFPLPIEKNTGQGFGSALTYLRRYCIVTILNICDEDDDGQKSEKPEGFHVATDAAKDKLRGLINRCSAPKSTKEFLCGKYNVSEDDDPVDFMSSAEVASFTTTLSSKIKNV